MKPEDLKAWRKKHKLTQVEAARCFGLSVWRNPRTKARVARSYQKLENGESDGIPNYVEIISRYIDRHGPLE